MNMSKQMKKITDVTNLLFLASDKILLGYKKRGFGKGKYNGFGGKPLPDETILDAAIREAKEESGLSVVDCQKVGIVDFGESYLLRMHLYVCTKWDGTPLETEEMRPVWFHINQIPYHQMWKDDKYWMPLVLQGKKFKGTFIFENNDDDLGTDDNKIISYTLEEIPPTEVISWHGK